MIINYLWIGAFFAMTLRHLTIFKEVCEKMSITQAAESLNMTQPAVSIAIKELEAFYSVKLFDRINRRIYMTEAGKILRRYADTIMERFDESVSVIRDRTNFCGCRMGVNIAVGEEFLPDILKCLKEKNPALRPSATIGNADTIEIMLSENDIDLAVTDTLNNRSGRVVSRLCSEEMKVVCSDKFFSGDSISVEKLAEQPLLLREKGSGCRDCIEAALKAHDCKITPMVESTSTLSLVNLAKKGLGMTVLPETLLRHIKENSSMHVVSVQDCCFERHHYITYIANKYMSAAIKQCIEEIKNFFGSDACVLN